MKLRERDGELVVEAWSGREEQWLRHLATNGIHCMVIREAHSRAIREIYQESRDMVVEDG